MQMEESLKQQLRRIYRDTKQAINECDFLTRHELNQILLTPAEEALIENLSGEASLIRAATLLRELHARFLRYFVLSAFDLTWDMITTPKRFEYAKQKELELYTSLMEIANMKQDEIKRALVAAKQACATSGQHLYTAHSSTSCSTSCSSASGGGGGCNAKTRLHNPNYRCHQSSLPAICKSEPNGATQNSCSSGSHTQRGGQHEHPNRVHQQSQHHIHHQHLNHQHHSHHNHIHEEQPQPQPQLQLQLQQSQPQPQPQQLQQPQEQHNHQRQQQQQRHACAHSHSTHSSHNNQEMEIISSQTELEGYRREIQESVLRHLNETIASKLVSSVDSLRSSYVGTLERCLASLEQNFIDHREAPNALLALRQILNAAYRVEVNVQSSTSVLRVLWEKMKQLIGKSLKPLIRGGGNLFYWTNYGIINDDWRRQQALDIIEQLDESRLAKSICAQFKERLRVSHELFCQSIKELELRHAGRLQHTEDLRLRVRKMHAPRMAKFALESTSLIDLILYGMPCLEKEIGRGQYGVVYACDSWAGHSPCAVKSVVPPDDKHWYDLAMEFYYTRCIPEHERIVSIFGSVIDHSYGSGSTPAVLLVMQRLNRDLYSAIKSGLDWLLRLQVAIDVVEGIRFLHNQGLVHRDIKLKNILLDEQNRAKITDLGFCKPEAMMSGSVVGTPIHMSPELFSGRYDNSVDVYAFGILFWYICAGHVRLPHIFELCQTRDQLWNGVKRGLRPERLPQFDTECWQLMAQCWDGDKTKRPHLGDVEIKLRQIQARYT